MKKLMCGVEPVHQSSRLRFMTLFKMGLKLFSGPKDLTNNEIKPKTLTRRKGGCFPRIYMLALFMASIIWKCFTARSPITLEKRKENITT